MEITGAGVQGLPVDLKQRSLTLTNDGVERVVNGTFTGNATGWTLASGWAYSANTVVKNAAGTGVLEQAIGAQASEIYILTGTVSNWTAGTTLTPSIGGVDGAALTGDGAFTQYIVTTGTGNLKFTPTTDVRCALDGISAKKIDAVLIKDSTGVVTGWIRGDGVSSLIASSISDGDTTHAPDGNSVFDALALKAPLASPTFTGTAAADILNFTGSMQLQENAPIILDAVLSADGKYSGITETGIAGETLAFGNICYFKAADSRWWLAKANATATSGAVQVGFCVLAGAAGAATTILRWGKINAAGLFDTFTISAPVHISAATAGKIVTAAPTGTTNFVVRIVGHAITGDEVFVNISPDYIELV